MINQPLQKFQFIEGLRGFAAFQVILLHYCAAFLPIVARVSGAQHFGWESMLSHSPGFILIDGYSAVYLFFVMSGFVLTPSFIHSDNPLPLLISKRFLRLFLPVFTAFLIGILLLLAMPHAKTNAFIYSQSPWLDSLGRNAMSIGSLAHDAIFNSMLIAYGDSSFFSGIFEHGIFAPTSISNAVNPPIWTLHVEFWGSVLLILLTCAYRYLARQVFWCVFILLIAIVGTSHYSLFLLGFVLYLFHAKILQRHSVIASVLGGIFCVLGASVCISKNWGILTSAGIGLKTVSLLSAESDFHWQSEFGAMLTFTGIMLNARIRSWFANRVFLWMGKVSFSVYLLHFPILLTLGCMIFSLLAQTSYLLAFGCALGIGIPATFCAAAIFERFIDRRAIAFSKYVGQAQRVIGQRLSGRSKQLRD